MEDSQLLRGVREGSENARNLKKGEAPFTWEEFVEKENKETGKRISIAFWLKPLYIM